jgi:phosphoribosylaminoimidazolecarboxamide formyltransferase/IMP cyclohydrolase
VAVVTSPDQYDPILKELKENESQISLETKINLQREAFLLTGRYDAAISAYLSPVKDTEAFPKNMKLDLEKVQDLRYGENPHQLAAFYKEEGGGLVDIKQLHGKELSFNNFLDLESAYGIVNYFADLTVAIVKHNNPCGVATSKTVKDAYIKALKCDPKSAYGGIIACNKEIDEAAAAEMFKLFAEVIIAPDFTKGAFNVLTQKKNLRLIKCSLDFNRKTKFDFKKVAGGFLVQQADKAELTISDIKTVTKKEPSLKEIEDLFFAWGISKFVKSNAIVIAKNGATLGIGAGQPNRVGSAKIALEMAGSSAAGAVMASDGFFPFADSVELAKKHKISALIQPGGSVRDDEVIKAADNSKMVMLFTGRRHFRH